MVRWIVAMLLACLVTVTWGCQAQESETAQTAVDLAPARTIQPGIGLDTLALGDTLDDAVAVLGEPQSAEPVELSLVCEGAVFYRWFDQGIDLRVCDDAIDRMFFYFHHENFAPFPGATAEGVGLDSNVDDVVAAYGEPEDQWTSPLGDSPIERYEYTSQGIIFAWERDKLQHILVSPPE